MRLFGLMVLCSIVIAVAIVLKFVGLAEGVQIWITLSLVVVTGLYVLETTKMRKSSEIMAKAALKQAEASNAMVDEMKQQRINASQPVLWPIVIGWAYLGLQISIQNIGNGPALDIDIYLGRGNDPMMNDCEHEWSSYLGGGNSSSCHFLRESVIKDKEKVVVADPKYIGDYTVFVEWRDLHMSGPFFQAKLSFYLDIDSNGDLFAKNEVVKINSISAKRKLLIQP